MISIYYNKTTLNDALVVAINDKQPTNIINEKNYSLIYHEAEIVGVNLFDASKSISLPAGFLFADQTIIDFVKQQTQINLDFEMTKKNFIVGLVRTCEPVASTHLHVCQVELENQTIKQIVCGAKNIRVGLKVVVVTPNSFLPDGSYIKLNKIMNLDSFGMICSAKELYLKDHNFNNDGIIELPDTFITGATFKLVYQN